jgi:hypothetical protein
VHLSVAVLMAVRFTFLHFGATDCREGLCGNTFIPNYLCDTLRPIANHCKVDEKQTQNPPRATSWGFDPPSRHHLSLVFSMSSSDIWSLWRSGEITGHDTYPPELLQ